MAQGTVHVDENGEVPKIDISIINEKSVAVSIFRLDPNTFEEELVVELGAGEENKHTIVGDGLPGGKDRRGSGRRIWRFRGVA